MNAEAFDSGSGWSWSGFWASTKRWVKEDGKRAVITMAIAFGVAWLVNVYLIAVRYEGTNVPPGGAATVSGNRITGMVFWLVLSTVVLTVVSYAQRVGWSRVGGELKVLPTNLMTAFQQGEADLQWAAVAWGAGVSLVVALVFSTAGAAAVGLGLVVVAASPLVAVLGRSIRRLGVIVLTRLAPERAPLLDSGTTTVATVLGAAVGMAVAWQVGPWVAKLVLAALAVGAAVILLKQKSVPGAAASLVLMGLVALAARELFDAVALADDGGWQEGGGSFTTWIRSDGSGRVMTQSVLGGLSSSVGAATGSVAGSVVASSSSQLAVGGLSGEFGAIEAGAEPAAPAAPTGPAADAGRETDAPSAGPDATGPGAGVDPPPPGDSTGGNGAAGGDGAGTSDDLAVGGLSGEFDSGGGSAGEGSGPGTGGAPGRTEPGEETEDPRS